MSLQSSSSQSLLLTYSFFVTDRVRRKGNVLTRPSIHPSVCLSSPRRGYPSQVQAGGGYPNLGGMLMGVPRQGVPWWGVPWLGGYSNGGYPTLGTPCQTWMGGYPDRGYPDGGTPLRLTDGVLDKRQSVYLLRSRRRTFLLIFFSDVSSVQCYLCLFVPLILNITIQVIWYNSLVVACEIFQSRLFLLILMSAFRWLAHKTLLMIAPLLPC